MALGDYPCGTGPCGFDPPVTTSRVLPVVPKALLIDLSVRTVPLDANGYALAMDPVDQEMTLCLGVELGTLPSAPNTGLNVQRILAAPLPSLPTVVNDEVALAAARPIAAGDVTLGRITATRNAGRLFLQVDYVNNRTTKPQTFTTPT